ncbi:hypothetical protein TNIN_384191 [Trichonephila inaurata madagascariensis]|uniref:Uncharacterized protein n=1 Tax=Trichonephila inaurata madagascariensis TaxID=2747483 RepID=A0A8X7BQ06_9ARAC|nr:hypothetical protein TNIN_44951 [Trichonephila inaurata madagascariensis]GFY73623.1 hypothetical protein TNIN_384191 [Trichonephila inaurata madagascariensis]
MNCSEDNKAWGAGTTKEQTVRRLFVKFCGGNMEIDHKPGGGHLGRCDIGHQGLINVNQCIPVRRTGIPASHDYETGRRPPETLHQTTNSVQ